jgi:hypothetical protein
MPFDQTPKHTSQIQEKYPSTRGAPAPAVDKNKMSSNTPAVLERENRAACWQGATPHELLLYGPSAAHFETTPAPNPAPPEPEEQVGAELTPRQLAFCERYVECPVATRAAREAGYSESTAATQASRLLKHPLVMRRVLELRRTRQLEAGFRRETLMDKFEAVFAEAIEGKDFYAAIQALTMQARLAGLTEAMPGLRYVRQGKTAGEQVIWDAVNRLEQKLSEITLGDYPGAAAASK